jgi:predicted porin
MKKTLIAAAVLATVGTSALAQSSVTVYGRVNVTIERQKFGDGDNNWVQQNNASRIGFRGTEDLGGGLKAGFALEHRFNINNGAQTNSAFWGGAGQSEVNLSGGFGMVRLGNFTNESYYATADYVSLHNHDTGTSADAFYADTRGFRQSNKVGYRTPSFGGVTLEVASNTTDATDPERTYDVAANYDAGPLHLGAGFQKTDDARQFAFRALYELGAFTLGGYVQRDEDVFAAGTRTTFRLSGMYTLGNAELHLNFGRAGDYSDRIGSLGDKASQYTLGANYNLSKRTKVYTFYTRISGDGAATYTGASGDGKFSSFAVGVRHNF